MHKLGIQWQRETDAVLDYNRLVLPTVLKSINCHDREFLQHLRNDNPHALLIYRHYPNYDDWREYPEQCALDAVGVIKVEITDTLNLFNLIEDNNEWVFPFFSDIEIDAADRYMATFIEAAWQETGLHSVFLNSACGNWGDDVIRFWRTLETAEEYGAILGQHEYDWPTMDRIYKESGDYWLCGKWKKSMAAIKAEGYDAIKCIITEAGIDGGVAGQPMKGWRSVPNALENYAASLLWYNDLLIADDDVIGVALFGISMTGDWNDFDIENSEVPNRIALFPTVQPPEPPEPPTNGGSDMRIPDRVKIFDFDHGPGDTQTASKEWLESIFGPCIDVHPITEIYQPQPGEIVYQLEWINCKPATTSCVIEVKGVDGEAVIDETVIFGWASADPHGLPAVGWRWTTNGAVGKTEPPDGHVGPGMSLDSYYSPDQGECGPHFLWIYGRPSEMVDGVGMLPFHHLVSGANHLHTEFGFRAVIWGGEEPPEEPVDGDIAEALWAIEATLHGMLNWLTDSIPEPPPIDQPFMGEYFNNPDLSGEPVFTRADLIIDFEWGSGSPDPRIDSDQFSVRWTGERTFEAGDYRFHTLTDDGVRLWVAGQLLIDQWHDQSETPYGATISLAAGEHVVQMDYYERGGGATAKLWWEETRV